MNLDILFSDNHLLALNKPSGLATQESGTHHDNLEDRARAWVKQEKNKPGDVYLHAVHRLDRAASGIVLCARTSKALSRLNTAIRNRAVEKIYIALVSGTCPKASGTLEHYLRHGSHHAEITAKGARNAKKAVLDYSVLSGNGTFSLIRIKLHTGRYHQIRAQLSGIHCPIIGDTRYGSDITCGKNRIALHHSALNIEHPVRKEKLSLNADIPAWFSKYVKVPDGE